ncbi:hypothetical protein [Trinickia diaoshuihuensis]|uniref:hypothetical protein n=1 Tax=Trinickia diaoshuihuensis TaxID=2292265 RepID=UPI0013C301DC|nr:hypothetical protein [Trinickia diaoshuihuensis]
MIQRSLFLIKKYKWSLYASLMYVAILLYPLLFIVLNPLPQEEALTAVRLRIIQASMHHPNVLAYANDAGAQTFEFPSPVYTITRGFGDPVAIDSNLGALTQGRVCEAQVDRMKFVAFASYTRIWSLECDGIQISYKEMAKAYKKALSLNLLLAIPFHAAMLFVVGLCVYGERKKI